MEQRTLRLGDTVDDYCPRERRITNHAIAVMSGDDVTQTRCTACEAEHPYKHGKGPQKKKRGDGGLYDEVLAGVLKPRPTVPAANDTTPTALAVEAAQAIQETPVAPAVAAIFVAQQADTVAVEATAEAADTPVAAVAEPEPAAFAWGHRPLIRAQLPRVEGQAPAVARALPDFTIRQQGSRGYGQPNTTNGSRRHGGGGGHGNGNGGGQGRGGRDQGGRSNGRSRHSR